MHSRASCCSLRKARLRTRSDRHRCNRYLSLLPIFPLVPTSSPIPCFRYSPAIQDMTPPQTRRDVFRFSGTRFGECFCRDALVPRLLSLLPSSAQIDVSVSESDSAPVTSVRPPEPPLSSGGIRGEDTASPTTQLHQVRF